jgi:hypothetical protein
MKINQEISVTVSVSGVFGEFDLDYDIYFSDDDDMTVPEFSYDLCSECPIADGDGGDRIHEAISEMLSARYGRGIDMSDDGCVIPVVIL